MTSSTEDAPFGGDFNGDGYGDVVIIHKNPTDSGANIHMLWGNAGGNMFQYNPTFVRSLPSGTWDWNNMKVAVGKFNGDAYADLATDRQRRGHPCVLGSARAWSPVPIFRYTGDTAR
jgi:hypothetical protein